MGAQVTALLALLRALLALVPLVGPYLAGRAQARQKAKTEALEADKKANERINHADVSSGNAADDRSWLRKRSGK